MATFVFVHGGVDGGWAWQGIGKILQQAGHEVYRPTLTGSGERAHLATPDIDLDTHLTDIIHVIRYENLNKVTLVGLSYGGYIIAGVAERIPERLHHLIFLDALVPEDGETLNEIMGPEYSAWAEEQASKFGDGWRIPPYPVDADRRTAMLIKPGSEPLQIRNPATTHLKHTFVHFTAKSDEDPLQPIMVRMAKRAKVRGWDCRELAVAHYPILSKPELIAALLIDLAT